VHVRRPAGEDRVRETFGDVLRFYGDKRGGFPHKDGSALSILERTLGDIPLAAFNTAVNMELMDRNPITRARFPKLKEVPRDATLSQEATQTLLSMMEKRAPRLLPMTRFALQVPCRKSELGNMKREDLDLFNNAIRVRNGTMKNDLGIWKPIPPNLLYYFRMRPSEYPFFVLPPGRRPISCHR